MRHMPRTIPERLTYAPATAADMPNNHYALSSGTTGTSRHQPNVQWSATNNYLQGNPDFQFTNDGIIACPMGVSPPGYLIPAVSTSTAYDAVDYNLLAQTGFSQHARMDNDFPHLPFEDATLPTGMMNDSMSVNYGGDNSLMEEPFPSSMYWTNRLPTPPPEPFLGLSQEIHMHPEDEMSVGFDIYQEPASVCEPLGPSKLLAYRYGCTRGGFRFTY